MFNNLLCRFIVSVCVCWCNVAVATGADLLSGFDKAKQDCAHFYCLDRVFEFSASLLDVAVA